MNDDNDKLYNVVIVTALILIAIVLYFVGGRAYRSWRAGRTGQPPVMRRSVHETGDTRSSPSSIPPMKVKRVEGRPRRSEPPPASRFPPAEDKRAR